MNHISPKWDCSHFATNPNLRPTSCDDNILLRKCVTTSYWCRSLITRFICQHTACISRCNLGIITIAIVVGERQETNFDHVYSMYISRSQFALLSAFCFYFLKMLLQYYHFTAPFYWRHYATGSIMKDNYGKQYLTKARRSRITTRTKHDTAWTCNSQ